MSKLEVHGVVKRDFAANLVRYRLLRALTQEELAERAELHPVFISGCERGKNNPSIGTLAMLARALDVNTAELLSSVQPNNGDSPSDTRDFKKPKVYASMRDASKAAQSAKS